MMPGKPKLGFPGKAAPIKIGGDLHNGFGIKSAVIDDYPVKFGLVRRGAPASSKKPPPQSFSRARLFYGQEEGK